MTMPEALLQTIAQAEIAATEATLVRQRLRQALFKRYVAFVTKHMGRSPDADEMLALHREVTSTMADCEALAERLIHVSTPGVAIDPPEDIAQVGGDVANAWTFVGQAIERTPRHG